jgi:hypothetical protein
MPRLVRHVPATMPFHFDPPRGQVELSMQRKVRRSLTGAFAPAAILLTSSFAFAAGADGLSPPPAANLRPAQCDDAVRDSVGAQDVAGCARISGYVAAGSEFAAGERIGGRPVPFAPPSAPIVTSVGAAESSFANAPRTEDSFFLQVSHDPAR